MPTEKTPASRAHHLQHILDHFDDFREMAIEDLTHYTSPWAVYTVDFLNTVAEIQGSDARIEERMVSQLAGNARRLLDPKVARLLREARDARSMKVDEIIGRIASECEDLPTRGRRRYRDIFRA
jgi:hypothetical protein